MADQEEADDPWGAFGSDSDASDDGDAAENNDPQQSSTTSDHQAAAQAVALHLAQSFLKLRALSLGHRRVGIFQLLSDTERDTVNNVQSVYETAIEARGITVVQVNNGDTNGDNTNTTDPCDAILAVNSPTANCESTDDGLRELCAGRILDRLVPGGSLLIATTDTVSSMTVRTALAALLDASCWQLLTSGIANDKTPLQTIYSSANTVVVACTKLPCRIQEHVSPWLPANHDVQAERQRAAASTVLLSAHEQLQQHALHEATIAAAVQTMQTQGFCVLPGLLNPETCLEWGNAVQQDFGAAAEILLKEENVDILHPADSVNEPATYRELSMREDLRLDLRSGPALNKLRGAVGVAGNQPWTVQADTPLNDATTTTTDATAPQFLRGHADLLQIVRRVMHPVDTKLSPGNFGRYNFSGRGPDGSFPDIRVGPVGGILSLPGSADQAMHADTPHLFEHLTCLPAHYINAFTPGCASDDNVGQTAMVPTSHRLDVTAEFAADSDTSRPAWWKHLVRPRLELGDVLLFDCRILHFGLANTSDSVQRPVLYTNMTLHWFTDPKNWDNQRPIFPTDDDDES